MKDRGIVIISETRKCDLVSKAYHASWLHLPLCSTKEQEDAQIAVRKKEKLLINGILLPFPEGLANWLAGSQYFPDTTMTDIETYLFKKMIENPQKRGKICMKAVMFLLLNTIIYQNARGFVTYVEKLYRKQESEKIHTVCGFASILEVGIYLQVSAGASLGMERAASMFLLYYII